MESRGRLGGQSGSQTYNRQTAQLSELEIEKLNNRREHERRRREYISKKLLTINNHCRLLRGKEEREQWTQRTDIINTLNLCQEVLEECLAFLKEKPGLFDEHLAFVKTYTEKKCQAERNTDGVRGMRQLHSSKENVPPLSAITPVSGLQKSTTSSPVVLSHPFADVNNALPIGKPEGIQRENLLSALRPPMKLPRTQFLNQNIWSPYSDD